MCEQEYKQASSAPYKAPKRLITIIAAPAIKYFVGKSNLWPLRQVQSNDEYLDLETSVGEGYAFGKYEQTIMGENRNKFRPSYLYWCTVTDQNDTRCVF